jgi:hypothetical protein
MHAAANTNAAAVASLGRSQAVAVTTATPPERTRKMADDVECLLDACDREELRRVHLAVAVRGGRQRRRERSRQEA